MGDAHVVPVQRHAFRQRDGRIDVVIDHQDATAMGGGGHRPHLERCDALHRAGKYDGERRPLPEAGALRADRSSVQLDQPAHEREADPEAALGVVLGARHLYERVEEGLQRLGRDADAAVAHADLELAVPLARRQLHASAVRRVLDRVREQVAEDLLQPDRIGVDHQRILRKGDRQLLAAGARHRRHRVRRFRDRLPHGEATLAQLDLAAADARDVEQLVDDPHHVAGLTLDDGQLALGGAAIPLHHLEGSHHRRERIAQLVPEHGEELVLAPVGVLQVAQQPRVVEGDGCLGGDAGEEPLVLGREVPWRAVHESEPAEELPGAQRDRGCEDTAHPCAFEIAGLHRLDPDRAGAAANPCQLVQRQIAELVAAPSGGREHARLGGSVEHGAELRSRQRGRFVDDELRQPIGVELGSERDPQPAEDGVDPAFLAQTHFVPALLVERMLQAGERVFGAAACRHFPPGEHVDHHRDGCAGQQRGEGGDERSSTQRRQSDEGQRPLAPAELDVLGLAERLATRRSEATVMQQPLRILGRPVVDAELQLRLRLHPEADGAAAGRVGGARRCGIPRAVCRIPGQAHRPRPVRAQCADRDRQRDPRGTGIAGRGTSLPR